MSIDDRKKRRAELAAKEEAEKAEMQQMIENAKHISMTLAEMMLASEHERVNEQEA